MKTSSWIPLLLIAGCAMAQEEPSRIKIDAQIRLRSEYDNRDFDSDTKHNTYDLLRTRVGVMFTPVDNVRAYIQLQDSRVFGKEASTLSDTRNVDLHQGYMEYRGFIWKKWDLKLGRMELTYGEERLIGSVGWSNVGRSFDAISNRFNLTNRTRLDFVTARLEEQSTPPAVADPKLKTNPNDNADRLLSITCLSTSFESGLQSDVYVISQTDEGRISPPSADSGKKELNQVTVGSLLKGGLGVFVYKMEAAYQTGKTAGRKTSAYMIAGSLAYTMESNKVKPQFTVGYDLLSGDAKPTDDRHRSFSTLFGTNHKFYGYMDYFIDIPVQTGQLGLQDAMAKIKLSPLAGSSLGIDYHYFMSAERGANGSKVFGQEIDVTATFKFNKYFAVDVGASVFLPGKLMKASFGTDDPGFWAYSSFVFSM